jgi:hypothetical protein
VHPSLTVHLFVLFSHPFNCSRSQTLFNWYLYPSLVHTQLFLKPLLDESENEPVDIPIPSAPKKSRKSGKARVVYVSEQDGKPISTSIVFLYTNISSDSDSIISVSESDSSLGLVGEDDDIENIFDDGNATEPDVQAHGGGLNFDDVAITALAKRVLAEVSEAFFLFLLYYF